jgi:hypothetical protein
MFEKQKLEAKEGSTAIQAGGNVSIGISYKDVKEIVYDLFKQNFPELLKEAQNQAQGNFEEYDKRLDEAIKRRLEEIDFNRFKEPNTQYLLNSSINHAARKGKTIDLGLLSETLVASLGKDNTEILNIVSEQALETIPKLTSVQIKILTLVHYLIHCGLGGIPNISFAEKNNAIVLSMVQEIPESLYSHLNYMSSLGVLSINQFQGINPYDAIKDQYQTLYKDTNADQIKSDVEKNSPSLAKLAQIYEEKQLRIVNLTPVGMLIALINMRRIFPVIDYKIWIK